MIFVINDLKYDTDKMELVSKKCDGHDVQLWRSVRGRWLLTYTRGYSTTYAKTLTEQEAKNMLKKYDLYRYEELFGELEEA